MVALESEARTAVLTARVGARRDSTIQILLTNGGARAAENVHFRCVDSRGMTRSAKLDDVPANLADWPQTIPWSWALPPFTLSWSDGRAGIHTFEIDPGYLAPVHHNPPPAL